MFGKKKSFRLERSYGASIDVVWQAWTDAEVLRKWWGPDGTTVDECEIDASVGGRVFIVTVGGEKMGKYAGTRWPMDGTFDHIDANTTLEYRARSWTEGEEAGSTIEHTNRVTFTGDGEATQVVLDVDITKIGAKAKMASVGMKMGYKSHLKRLDALLGEG